MSCVKEQLKGEVKKPVVDLKDPLRSLNISGKDIGNMIYTGKLRKNFRFNSFLHHLLSNYSGNPFSGTQSEISVINSCVKSCALGVVFGVFLFT